MNEPRHTRRVVELKIPNELGYEKVARDAVATIAKRLNFSDDRIADIKLAVAEACTNAMSHGSPPDSLTRIVVVLTTDEHKLEILVKDSGFGSPPTEITVPDIHKMVAGKAKLGGMGLYIIHELVDKATFIKNHEDGSNSLQMVIYRMDDETLTEPGQSGQEEKSQ